jgi:predicted flavoprotein YhiN
MGINVAAKGTYEDAVRKLFPQGEWWDGQLADPESDVSLFAGEKAEELLRFRRRMADLFLEGRTETATETLDDWERVLLGTTNQDLDVATRRAVLATGGGTSPSTAAVKEAGRSFGIEVTEVTLPFRPALFGHARFGLDFIAGIPGFSALLVHARPCGGHRAEFEEYVRSLLLAANTVNFIYTEAGDGGNVS